MFRINTSGILALTVAISLAASNLMASNADNPKLVEVTNFPEAQGVTGTVSVDNLPAIQTVDGTVTVSNLPATQTVNGTVSISNLPVVQQVIMLPQATDSGQISFDMFELSDSIEMQIPGDVVMTDVVINAIGYDGAHCMFTIWKDAPAIENILLRQFFKDEKSYYSLHLNTGFEGPLTMQVANGGIDGGSCRGTLFWTGYIQ